VVVYVRWWGREIRVGEVSRRGCGGRREGSNAKATAVVGDWIVVLQRLNHGSTLTFHRGRCCIEKKRKVAKWAVFSKWKFYLLAVASLAV